MGWFWTDSPSFATTPPQSAIAPLATTSPVEDKKLSSRLPPSSTSCPYAPPTAIPSISEQPPKSSSWTSKINPLNFMPSLPNLPTTSQDFSLPLEREGSSIPRGPCATSSPSRGCPVSPSSSSSPAENSAYADSTSGKWQYPSPQQMYNALLRKGYSDTDPTAVPAMVAVHNFLNEGAWAEILEWERRFTDGLYSGWQISSRGEENSYFGAMTELEDDGWRKAMRSTRLRLAMMANQNKLEGKGVEDVPEPRLLKFEGRPQDRTPRSRWLEFLGKMWPAEYSSQPPFDRHDWYVLRHSPDGSTKEVRYVIDYYSGPTEATGEPVFYLDVRPAIDGPTGLGERVLRWGGDAWWRASGGATREQSELERKIQEARDRRTQRGER